MNDISNIYIINLDKDKDRLQNIKEQCNKQNLKEPIRIAGVYGKKLTYKERNEAASYMYSKIGSKSAIGCAMSHIKAWKTMVDNGDKNAIFLEDDAVLNSKFKEYFEKIYPTIPKDFNIVYLGCTVGCNINKKFNFEYPIIKLLIGKDYAKEVKKINNHVYVPSLPLALHGYLLSLEGAKYLLDKIKEDKITFHIDAQILKYIKDIPSYAINPELVKQSYKSNTTSNNVSSVYPCIINNMLEGKDEHDEPYNYKLTIDSHSIFDYGINTYTYLSLIIGLILGLSKINYSSILKVFIIFHIIEYLNKTYSAATFIKHTFVTYLLIYIGWTIGINFKTMF